MLLEELTQIPSLKMVSHSKIRATLDIIFKDIPTHCIQNTEENLDFYNYLKVSKPKKERNKAADLQNEADKDQFNRVVTPIMHSIISNMHNIYYESQNSSSAKENRKQAIDENKTSIFLGNASGLRRKFTQLDDNKKEVKIKFVMKCYCMRIIINNII